MTRILLVKPDFNFVSDITPPLGLGYLAAVARQAGHDVQVLDNRLSLQGQTAFHETLQRWRPDIVGISAISSEAEAARRLAEMARTELPNAAIIIGGTFPSTDSRAALFDGLIDLAVLGEGEQVFSEVIACLHEGRDSQKVPGVAYRGGDGEVIQNPASSPIADLDTLPFPAWDLLDMNAYFHVPRQGYVYKHRKYFPVFTSRGCPYQCIYCHNQFGKRFRTRSPEGVLAEIEQLIRVHGIREIHFVDDTFNLDLERASAILNGIIDRGWKLALSFPNGLRGDLLNERLIDLMSRAGTYRVCVAFESGSERIQRLIRKNLDLDRTRENVALLAKKRILTHAFFMIGFPTETREEALTTARVACSTRADAASFFYVNPFPGTELARMAGEQGKGDIRALRRTSYFDPRVADLGISEIPPDELRAIVRSAWRRFYLFRPYRLWRIFWKVPHKLQLLVLAMRTFSISSGRSR